MDVKQHFEFRGCAAAVTGAASGIGRALAMELAARGSDLALADINAAALEKLAAEVRSAHARRVTVRQVDVADRAQVDAFAAAAHADFPRLNLAVNNAGVALLGQFDEYDQSQLEWLMGINFWGVVHGTRAFVPLIAQQPQAHIVNMSSIFGIIAPAGQSAYSAAKFAVRGYSEAVRHELAVRKSAVRLSVVHPGGVATNIARKARAGAYLLEVPNESELGERFEKMASTSAQSAARRIIRGIERNEPRILIGRDAKYMDLLQRFRPAGYWSTLERAYNRLASAK